MDLNQVTSSTDGSVGYTCPDIVLYRFIKDPITGSTKYQSLFATFYPFITSEKDDVTNVVTTTIVTSDQSLAGYYLLGFKLGLEDY